MLIHRYQTLQLLVSRNAVAFLSPKLARLNWWTCLWHNISYVIGATVFLCFCNAQILPKFPTILCWLFFWRLNLALLCSALPECFVHYWAGLHVNTVLNQANLISFVLQIPQFSFFLQCWCCSFPYLVTLSYTRFCCSFCFIFSKTPIKHFSFSSSLLFEWPLKHLFVDMIVPVRLLKQIAIQLVSTIFILLFTHRFTLSRQKISSVWLFIYLFNDTCGQPRLTCTWQPQKDSNFHSYIGNFHKMVKKFERFCLPSFCIIGNIICSHSWMIESIQIEQLQSPGFSSWEPLKLLFFDRMLCEWLVPVPT